MIVAIAQAVFSSGKRSHNLAALTTAVNQAARLTRAPDLILLPNGADLPLGTEQGSLLTPAMCQGLTETLAWLAREWGVWIAMGHALPRGGELVSAVTLFDPDGDPYLRFAAGEADRPFAIRATPLGVVALGTTAALGHSDLSATIAECDLDLIVLAPAVAIVEAKPLCDLAKTAGAYVCLVNHNLAAGNSSGDASVLIDRTGKVLAQTEPEAARVVAANLDIAAPAADLIHAWKEEIEGE